MSKFRETVKTREGIIKSFTEFGGSWLDYKRYLFNKNALSPNIDPNSENIPIARPSQKKVSWAWKTWNEMEAHERDELLAEMITDADRGGDKWKYFRKAKLIPNDVMDGRLTTTG